MGGALLVQAVTEFDSQNEVLVALTDTYFFYIILKLNVFSKKCIFFFK